MYHDKHFQTDVNFPFVAFSHSQIKATTTGGFLVAERANFSDIANRILNVNQDTLADLAKRLSEGESVKPDTDEEKECFKIIHDLDHIAGKVEGSVTSKKYMHNEIWSLIASQGAHSWYITLSPADSKQNICLYFADTNETFKLCIQPDDERFRLIAGNPVAAARFFHFMITLFIEHVLGFDKDKCGLYGDCSAYYGTVEQQGRLTLHLHLLLWLRGGLTPDDTRKCIMDPDSDFQRLLVSYLESVHSGDFNTGSREEVLSTLAEAKTKHDYIDPTETLPVPPPKSCPDICGKCTACTNLQLWRLSYTSIVDDILAQSNIHTCSTNKNKDGTQNKRKQYKGCLDNVWNKCKARFPCPLFDQTEVDPTTGALNLKKTEPWINTYTPAVSYLFRCNTDVSSLRSGTAIKGVLLYVSDYITKQGLKTHIIFDVVHSIFQKNSQLIAGTEPQAVKACKLMTKMVNQMSAKMEFGSPMISMYLLQNPDHYTSHKFVTFYWQPFIHEICKAWGQDTSSLPDKVSLIKSKEGIEGLSFVHDYIYCSPDIEDMSLYEWISRCKCESITKGTQKVKKEASTHLNNNFDNILDVMDDDKCDTAVTWYELLQDHALAKTHGTRRTSVSKQLIPNFVGATLPHCDHGHCEYYCTTMLCLFKPWRSGLELKNENESWDEAFLAYKFSMAQEVLMKNFNIR